MESDSISDNEPSFTETYGLLLILVLPIIAFFVVWSLVKRFNPQGASSFLESVRSFNEVNTSGLIKGLVVAGGLVLAFNKCSNSTPSHNETEGSAYNYVNKKIIALGVARNILAVAIFMSWTAARQRPVLLQELGSVRKNAAMTVGTQAESKFSMILATSRPFPPVPNNGREWQSAFMKI